MELLIESMAEEWQNFVKLIPRIVLSLLIVTAFIWIGRLVGKAVRLILDRRNFKPTHTNFFRSLTAWIMAIFGIIIGFNILGLKSLAASLVAGGGITAVILGFAFREIGENFLAGFFLAFSRPFEIGNLIQSGDLQGVVRSIDLRSTHIRTADGRDIFIPSSQIFNNPLINFTKDGLRRLSFTVGIDYADDSHRAREILIDVARSIQGILTDPEPGANIYALEAQFVVLEVTFWIDTFQEGINLLKVKNDLMEQSRRALADNGFTFSSSVTANVSLGSYQPLDVRINRDE